MRRIARLAALSVLALVFSLSPGAASAAGGGTLTGTFEDGSTYLIEVPADWNGTLLLYSHGYNAFPPNPARDVGDPVTRAWALDNHFALAGSSYSTLGWSVQQAFTDQIMVLDTFGRLVGKPKRTIAWGHSLGGMITAGLVQLHPERFQGALPMCGVVAGGIGVWNQALDSEFAFKTLLAPDSALKLVNLTQTPPFFYDLANVGVAEGILSAAQATPQGRARIALSAALSDTPGWYDPTSPEPAPTDYAAQEVNQSKWDANPDFFFIFGARAELERRAGGNYTWNTDVDYRVQLAHSADRAEVEALYKSAGLNLDADLATLNATARISANGSAVDYVKRFIIYNGDLDMPVLTMHTTGDGLVQPSGEQAYAQVVREAGDNALLREVFVHRAGHCAFTPAETVTALKTLIHRLDTGRWERSTSPSSMNEQAAALGSGLNVFLLPDGTSIPANSAFTEFTPPRFLRPFDALTSGEAARAA
jgi:pimeloyl-ACP methyl ester carboxylesterase